MRAGKIPRFTRNDKRRRTARKTAFTLLELLVVVAIIALLLSLLLPSVRLARRQAKKVNVHSDLRQITLALDAYAMDNKDNLPPTRCGCGVDVYYQLPIELASDKYLPKSPDSIPQADFPDLFNPTQTYKYRAPGPQILNGSLNDDPDNPSHIFAKIWVPEDFPRNKLTTGQYFDNKGDTKSPVHYAVWSMGPNRQSQKFPQTVDRGGRVIVQEGRLPLPQQYWMRGAADEGVITHYETTKGVGYTSP